MSSSRFKIRNPPKKCIFCGNGKLSGEHIWPDWAAPLFADTPATGVVEASATSQAGIMPPLSRKTRQGKVIQKKIYAVCQPCNNEWMSALEIAAKPILLKLQAAEKCTLGERDQVILTQWITLKIMVSEHSLRDQAVFTRNMRTAFYERRDIPVGLRIWLFRCGEGIWRSGYARHTTAARPFLASEIPNIPDMTKDPANVESVALGFNELFVYANFTLLPDLNLDLNLDSRVGMPLWPLRGVAIHWPPLARLPASAANALAERLTRLPRVSLKP